MKKVLIIVLVILAVLAAAGTFFVGKLDGYIAEVIQKEGTKALGTSVRVSSVETKFKEGIASINGLTVANPSGYQSASALSVAAFTAEVDYQSKVVNKILINKPVINAELIGTKSNFKDLLDNIPSSGETSSDSSGDDIEITIKSFQLRQATVNLISDKLGQQTFVMDDFVLSNLQGTPEQITSRLTSSLTKHVNKQVQSFAIAEISKRVKSEAKKKVKDAINEKISDKLGGKLKGFKLKLN